MAKARYEPILVSRVPAVSGPPILTEIDEVIINEKLAWSDELSDDGGYISFAMDPDQQSPEIKELLIDTSETPVEIWLYRNGILVQAGPVIGVQPQSGTVNPICRGLLYYLRYMFVTSDLVYTNEDQYNIVKGLVNHWQNKSYGHFGIDTTGIGLSGFYRTITYHAAETPNVLQVMISLAENLDGFEFSIDPITRDLELVGRKGTDKSSSIILDSRNITSPSAYYSTAHKDFGTHAIAAGGSIDNTVDGPVIGTAVSDTAKLAKVGRMGIAISVDTVTQQGIIDDYAGSLLAISENVHFIPGPGSLIPILGVDVMDFESGDTVTWTYNYGLGLMELQRDVYKKVITVDGTGQETITVEFF